MWCFFFVQKSLSYQIEKRQTVKSPNFGDFPLSHHQSKSRIDVFQEIDVIQGFQEPGISAHSQRLNPWFPNIQFPFQIRWTKRTSLEKKFKETAGGVLEQTIAKDM